MAGSERRPQGFMLTLAISAAGRHLLKAPMCWALNFNLLGWMLDYSARPQLHFSFEWIGFQRLCALPEICLWHPCFASSCFLCSCRFWQVMLSNLSAACTNCGYPHTSETLQKHRPSVTSPTMTHLGVQSGFVTNVSSCFDVVWLHQKLFQGCDLRFITPSMLFEPRTAQSSGSSVVVWPFRIWGLLAIEAPGRPSDSCRRRRSRGAAVASSQQLDTSSADQPRFNAITPMAVTLGFRLRDGLFSDLALDSCAAAPVTSLQGYGISGFLFRMC